MLPDDKIKAVDRSSVEKKRKAYCPSFSNAQTARSNALPLFICEIIEMVPFYLPIFNEKYSFNVIYIGYTHIHIMLYFFQ